MKVYRGYDQKLRLFRPQLNCDRMIKSNERVCLPSFDSEELLAIIADFLATECPRWLPESGSNLYVRPAMVGSGSALGIQKPPEALFFLFAALFPQPTGLPSPGMRLLASDPEFIRAWPGGFGSSKVGASYGPAMVAQAKARQNNCGQTLWLYGDEELVTEAGASNFFLIWKRKGSEDLELVTSPLDTELILDGIHRRSVLELARKRLDATSSQLPANLLPLKTLERPLTMTEIVEAHRESRLIEAFVSGTAVSTLLFCFTTTTHQRSTHVTKRVPANSVSFRQMFVTPVSGIRYKSTDIQFPMTVTTDGQKTPVSTYSAQIKAWLEDIMYGGVEHEWAYIIDEDKPM